MSTRNARTLVGRLALLVMLGLVAGLATACGDEAAGGKPTGPRAPRSVKEVWTTTYPTAYMTQRIAGDTVKVVYPVPEGKDPAYWQPPDDVLRGYQEADLVVINGATYEQWLETVSFPVARLANVSKPLETTFLELEGGATHSHGSGPAHTHAGIDGHTWVDLVNAKTQALAIRRDLVLLLPEHAAAYATGYERLASDLEGLDAAFRGLGALPEGEHLYFAHPTWNYAARRYGWRRVNLSIAPEDPLQEADVQGLRTHLATKPGRFLLWESAPLPATAERLHRELGLTSVVLPTCASESAADRAAGRDYLARMQANVESLRPAFQPR